MSDVHGTQDRRETEQRLRAVILVLTALSLGIMVVLVLPVSDATEDLLIVYDNAICVVFLIDFFSTLLRASTKREYFIGRRGWLDLLLGPEPRDLQVHGAVPPGSIVLRRTDHSPVAWAEQARADR